MSYTKPNMPALKHGDATTLTCHECGKDLPDGLRNELCDDCQEAGYGLCAGCGDITQLSEEGCCQYCEL